MNFPVAVGDLVGHHILLIGVEPTDPHRTRFVAGPAMWHEPELRVAALDRAATLVLRGHAEALRGFDPAVLPALLTDDAWRVIAPLARGCDACVVGFVAAGSGGVELLDPFCGMAMNPETDEIYLMRCDDPE